ncbi:hypothetical protein QJQ45_017141 [Haematococcus lacustris]|nr:hypothetical protein QJQ45_017141 [Haematococcus lacustris]
MISFAMSSSICLYACRNRRDELVAGGISVPSSLCCRRTGNSRLHPRMPVNHPHLKNPAARNEPNAKRCALCELIASQE